MGASRIYVLLVHGTCTSYKANGMYVPLENDSGGPGAKSRLYTHKFIIFDVHTCRVKVLVVPGVF